MGELKNFIASNPQVSASMITALFGILGIFINIFINLWFRNRDYKNKNFMQQVENLEKYYVPLGEKTKYFINCIQNVTRNESDDIYDILEENVGAKYASSIRTFKEVMKIYNKFFVETEYRYPNDYKLFKIHKKVKEKVFVLNQFEEKKIKMTSKETVGEIMLDLRCLVYQIQQYENKIVISNCIARRIEIVKFWFMYKVLKNVE